MSRYRPYPKIPKRPQNMNRVDRFWSYVNKTESIEDCWIWIGAKTKGYGIFWDGV